jgi:Transposase DDE domain group 1
MVKEGTLRVQATNSWSSFEVTTDGTGVVGHAGAALLRELADRLGLTAALGWRDPQGRRRYPDAAVLRDLAVVLADGGDCLSDLAVLRDQPELFGPVASTATAWRVLERVASDPDGLARLRAARAHARGRAERCASRDCSTARPRLWAGPRPAPPPAAIRACPGCHAR